MKQEEITKKGYESDGRLLGKPSIFPVVSSSGSVLMECILVLPLLFILMMAVLQYAHIWTAKQVVAYAAFTAARATLSVPPYEEALVARRAAREVCAWITMASIPGSHGAGEVSIPGWGTIPESNSVDRRLKVTVDPYCLAQNVERHSIGVTSVTVRFRFALLIPIAGQMISWLAHHKQGENTGTIKVGMGWTGEQTLLPEEGGDSIAPYASGDAFPYLELEETSVLPRPYSTRDFPASDSSFLGTLYTLF